MTAYCRVFAFSVLPVCLTRFSFLVLSFWSAFAVCFRGLPSRFAFAVCLRSLPSRSAFAVCLRGLPSRSAFAVCFRGLLSRSAFAVCGMSTVCLACFICPVVPVFGGAMHQRTSLGELFGFFLGLAGFILQFGLRNPAWSYSPPFSVLFSLPFCAVCMMISLFFVV